MAELVDALDLGSSVYDVQVRVLSGALFRTNMMVNKQKIDKNQKKNLNFSWQFEIKCLHLHRFMWRNHIYMSNYNLKINEKENY